NGRRLRAACFVVVPSQTVEDQVRGEIDEMRSDVLRGAGDIADPKGVDRERNLGIGFAELYVLVTRKVDDGVRSGSFDGLLDGDRVANVQAQRSAGCIRGRRIRKKRRYNIVTAVEVIGQIPSDESAAASDECLHAVSLTSMVLLYQSIVSC